MLSRQEIIKAVKSQGFDLCGVTSCRHMEKNEKAFLDWLSSGNGSTLDYLSRNLDKRFDTSRLMEGAKSVVVCAISYKNEVSGSYTREERNKIASYACTRDYHLTIKEKLFQLLKGIMDANPGLKGRVFTDSAPLLEKQLAVDAGLGWIGRQSLLVNPVFGSYLLLGEILLNDTFDEYDKPYEGVGCAGCNRCQESCPNQAILGHMINTAKCISRATIEKEKDSEIQLHGWIFGCDVCQAVCPYNKSAKMHVSKDMDMVFDPRILAEKWEDMTEEEFDKICGQTPLCRSGLERIRRNTKR